MVLNISTYQMSTFSEHNSFRMTSGAIHATVPANDILVLFSFQVLWVPKSEILTTSFLPIRTLKLWIDKSAHVLLNLLNMWSDKMFGLCILSLFRIKFNNEFGKKEIKCEVYNIFLAHQNTDIINRGSCTSAYVFLNLMNMLWKSDKMPASSILSLFCNKFNNEFGKKEIKCEAYNIILALQNTEIIIRGSYKCAYVLVKLNMLWKSDKMLDPWLEYFINFSRVEQRVGGGER